MGPQGASDQSRKHQGQAGEMSQSQPTSPNPVGVSHCRKFTHYLTNWLPDQITVLNTIITFSICHLHWIHLNEYSNGFHTLCNKHTATLMPMNSKEKYTT